MRRIIVFLMLCTATLAVSATGRFVRVEGENLVRADGSRLYITGTNLGNWLNPEGYMFGFSKTNSGWMIDIMLRQMVGPDETAAFWKAFKDSYITRDDIRFIASTGANTVRLPFNYKLFTDEDYMGLSSAQDGFARVDSLVSWCRDYGLYLILDMHDCPGGQTGDNIDDSYGYPWLFESDTSRRQFIRIWCDIASRYKDESVILGYELMNEPIAHFFENKDELNEKLEPLYRQAVNAIRKIDSNHVILLGGAQWNSVFSVFSDWKFDANIMYTCHRYGGPATAEAIKDYIEFRDRTGLPMYMGELGHNTDEWQADFVNVLRSNNIGYTFWPYKKVDGSCMSAVVRPEGWDSVVVRFSESVRTTYADIRMARPAQDEALRILRQYIENVKFANCRPQYSYIKSTGLRAG